MVRGVLDEWELASDGVISHGTASIVLPVRTTSGRPAVLKIGRPDPRSEHEALALQHWHGRGAVQLLRADPHRRALLLERLHPEDLTAVSDIEACEIVARLYGALHIPAPTQLPRLSALTGEWGKLLSTFPHNGAVPRRLVEQATAIANTFAVDGDTDGRLLHTDLHYGCVLAAERQPWLAIGPKPLSGDPHFELAPMLLHRWDEIVGAWRVREALRARFHALVDSADLDEDRARDWVVLRVVVNAVEEGRSAKLDRDGITRCLTIAKAVQD